LFGPAVDLQHIDGSLCDTFKPISKVCFMYVGAMFVGLYISLTDNNTSDLICSWLGGVANSD